MGGLILQNSIAPTLQNSGTWKILRGRPIPARSRNGARIRLFRLDPGRDQDQGISKTPGMSLKAGLRMLRPLPVSGPIFSLRILLEGEGAGLSGEKVFVDCLVIDVDQFGLGAGGEADVCELVGVKLGRREDDH